jgi:hypothetical protein
MPVISKKKEVYPVSGMLTHYLKNNERAISIDIDYDELLRFSNSITLYDKRGDDTLWETTFYPHHDMDRIYHELKKIYSLLKADGDLSVMNHLFIDRVDLCMYGNTQPFRVRIVNRINDNFDYFYVKRADASRIYGLELEHLLSPNRISFLIHNDTLIEEHIAGLPGEQFFNMYIEDENLNRIRLAKEFIKFNERCFVRLLGDMHSSNFVIDITPDFDDLHYRIRAIDFDQQSYEGKKKVYMPQYFKQNNPIIEVGLTCMTPETVRQYQTEERSLIANRVKTSRYQLKDLLDAMSADYIAPQENVYQLRDELADHYKSSSFKKCRNMGEIVKMSLRSALT